MAPIIIPRQSTGSPSSNNCPSTLSGGAIAGIVLGTIAGTLLILWLFRVCMLPGAPANRHPESEIVYTSSPSQRRRRHRSRPTDVEYVEKVSPRRSGGSRYSRTTGVTRPERVYVTSS